MSTDQYPPTALVDERARERGVLLLGECGLDPGIDSMSVYPLCQAKLIMY